MSILLNMLALLLCISIHTIKGIQATQPNIILLLADDLGYGDLSFNGNPYQTPNIDRLASKSLYFNQYYSPASVCTPSRGSMLTGQYFRRLGLYPGVIDPYMVGGLNQSYVIFPSILGQNNYTTGFIGKWHLGLNNGHSPWEHGLNYYYGMPLSQDVCYSDIDGAGSITNNSYYGYCPIFQNDKIILQNKLNFSQVDQLYFDNAINFTDNIEQPYFLQVSFHHAHLPLYPSDIYHSSITALDNWIGNFMDHITNNNQNNDRQTIIIFTSDNGALYRYNSKGGDNSPFRCCKGSTWEGGHRVPAMIYFEGINARRSNMFITGLDWFSTILSMAQISNNDWFDGYNFWNYFNDTDSRIDLLTPREEFYYHSVRTFESIKSVGSVMGMRYRNYKLNTYTSGGNAPDDFYDRQCRAGNILGLEPMFYDLYNDNGEKYNLINDTEYYNIIELMKLKIANHTNTFIDKPSEVLRGRNLTGFPCANYPCTNYPACCQTF